MEPAELGFTERNSIDSFKGEQALLCSIPFKPDNQFIKGEGVPKAFECVYQSSHLNAVRDLADNTGAQFLTQSVIWSRLGNFSNDDCKSLLIHGRRWRVSKRLLEHTIKMLRRVDSAGAKRASCDKHGICGKLCSICICGCLMDWSSMPSQGDTMRVCGY